MSAPLGAGQQVPQAGFRAAGGLAAAWGRVFPPTGQGPRATWCLGLLLALWLVAWSCHPPAGWGLQTSSCPQLACGAHVATWGLEAEGVSNGTRALPPHPGSPSLGQGQSGFLQAAPDLRGSRPLGVLAGSALVP